MTIGKIKIANEEMLFDILVNQKAKYPALTDIEFCDNFINSIKFSLKIEGKVPTGEPIQGHVTTDLLNICNAWQDAIYSIYASVVKNKDDVRSLTKIEREKLSLIFKIKEGSTEQTVENISKIIHSLKDMDPIKFGTLVAGLVLITGFVYFSKVQINNKDKNTDKEKFLTLNQTIQKAMNDLKEVAITAITCPKLNIEKATIDGQTITKEQIQEIYDDMQNEEDVLAETEVKNFIVRKLYKKGSKKMATLSSDNIDIDVSFANNLFEENETIFINSFSREQNIKCEVLIEKLQNGTIKKATLLKLITPTPQK
jgi:hypothetical protein